MSVRELVACCLLSLSFVFTPNSSYGAELHAFIVADTNDKNIGVSTKTDEVNMVDEMKQISESTGLELDLIDLTGKEVTPETVLKKIKKLKAESDDVILFYFSGHGYRTAKKGASPWPFLYFSNTNSGIDLDHIVDKLKEKNPRLLFVMSDSCNNTIGWEPPVVRGLIATATMQIERVPLAGYNKLFIEYEGLIIAVGVEAGGVSLGDWRGGFFTRRFLLNLHWAVANTAEPDWEEIFTSTEWQVATITAYYLDPPQRPIHQLLR